MFERSKTYRYAGIGSRKTPQIVVPLIHYVSGELADLGYELYSGGAPGADTFFERGCDIKGGRKTIWRPYHATEKSNSIARGVMGADHWSNCSAIAKKLHSRNCFQILGEKLNNPVDFVICWTHGGEITGGTATAIKIAMEYGVPILNLGLEPKMDEIFAFLKENT